MEPTGLTGYALPAMSDPGWKDFIRESRVALGLTQAELARKLSALTIQVSRWETGKQTPPPLKREAIRKTIARLLARKPPNP